MLLTVAVSPRCLHSVGLNLVVDGLIDIGDEAHEVALRLVLPSILHLALHAFEVEGETQVIQVLVADGHIGVCLIESIALSTCAVVTEGEQIVALPSRREGDDRLLTLAVLQCEGLAREVHSVGVDSDIHLTHIDITIAQLVVGEVLVAILCEVAGNRAEVAHTARHHLDFTVGEVLRIVNPLVTSCREGEELVGNAEVGHKHVQLDIGREVEVTQHGVVGGLHDNACNHVGEVELQVLDRSLKGADSGLDGRDFLLHGSHSVDEVSVFDSLHPLLQVTAGATRTSTPVVLQPLDPLLQVGEIVESLCGILLSIISGLLCIFCSLLCSLSSLLCGLSGLLSSLSLCVSVLGGEFGSSQSLLQILRAAAATDCHTLDDGQNGVAGVLCLLCLSGFLCSGLCCILSSLGGIFCTLDGILHSGGSSLCNGHGMVGELLGIGSLGVGGLSGNQSLVGNCQSLVGNVLSLIGELDDSHSELLNLKVPVLLQLDNLLIELLNLKIEVADGVALVIHLD